MKIGRGEDFEHTAPVVSTASAAAAFYIDGELKFNVSPKITSGSSPSKIKINVTNLLL
jgi:hypothetical protein